MGAPPLSRDASPPSPLKRRRNPRRGPSRISYNARKNGALCGKCPLRGRPPIPATVPKRARLTVIGEAPGRVEESEGRYFVGESGKRLNAACIAFDIDRSSDLHINNAIQCRPDRKLEPHEWREAVACCFPRLRAEVERAGTPWILNLGRRSMLATLDINDHMKNYVGSVNPVRSELAGIQTVTTIHPAFALRGNPAWMPVFYTHFQRAWEYAIGKDKPKAWPALHWRCNDRTLAALERLSRTNRVHIDVETAGIDPAAPLTAIGIGRTDLAVSIPWEPELFFETKRQALRARQLIARILGDASIAKSAHNGLFDLTVFADNGFTIRNYASDTLIKHHVNAPQLRHGLQIAYLLEHGAEPWKTHYHVLGDEKGAERFKRALETDEGRRDLCVYNAKDCVAGDRIDVRGSQRLRDVHNGPEIFAGYMRRAMISLKMRDHGARVNMPVLAKHDKALSSRRYRARRELALIAVRTGAMALLRRNAIAAGRDPPVRFNPNALAHNRALFFGALGCKPIRINIKSGTPSLDNRTLRLLLVDSRLSVRRAARALVRYRRWQKLLRTYVQRLVIDSKKYVHADPKVWGAYSGRWSYGSKANPFSPQIIPKPNYRKGAKGQKILVAPGLRDIIAPRPGNWIVEADYSQLEARIIAYLANDLKMLALFERGEDLHDWTAAQLFGDSFSKGERDLAKRARYAWQYGAEPQTAWLSLVIDAPGLYLSDVERLWERLSVIHAPIKQWQNASVKQARISDYVEAPISGRRFYFHGEIEPSKVYNLPVQGTGADLIDTAIEGVAADVDWRRSFVLFQVHDAIVCDAPDPVAMARTLKRHMEQEPVINGIKCSFPIDFKISPSSWGECVEYNAIDAIAEAFAGKGAGNG